jgi:hypothetical protein
MEQLPSPLQIQHSSFKLCVWSTCVHCCIVVVDGLLGSFTVSTALLVRHKGASLHCQLERQRRQPAVPCKLFALATAGHRICMQPACHNASSLHALTWKIREPCGSNWAQTEAFRAFVKNAQFLQDVHVVHSNITINIWPTSARCWTHPGPLYRPPSPPEPGPSIRFLPSSTTTRYGLSGPMSLRAEQCLHPVTISEPGRQNDVEICVKSESWLSNMLNTPEIWLKSNVLVIIKRLK